MRLLICAAALLLLSVGIGARIIGADESRPKPGNVRHSPAATPFVGDFETGTTDQWTWGVQCANNPALAGNPDFGTITVESDIVGQGRYAARIDLPAAEESNSCEVLARRPIGIGTDDYYALMVRFPDDWQEPSGAGWGLSIAQFNFENIWGTPVQLVAHRDRLTLVLQSGLCRSLATGAASCTYSSGIGGNLRQLSAVPAPLVLRVWHELIVHVHWATDSSGLVEVWHRIQGQAGWTKTVVLRGRPTLQWTSDIGPSGLRGLITADKLGAYRGWARFPITIWEDGFARMHSFAAAASRLP